MADRPPIPAQMRRDVLIEAGYRCAIPRCGQTVLEIDHIDDYAKVKEHQFDNLIALCPNCHQRKTRGEIDRKALLQIKANLSILNHRYSDLERRFLEECVTLGLTPNIGIVLPGGFGLLMRNLVLDGLVTEVTSGNSTGPAFAPVSYVLTKQGHDFIIHWLGAQPLD